MFCDMWGAFKCDMRSLVWDFLGSIFTFEIGTIHQLVVDHFSRECTGTSVGREDLHSFQ